MAFADQQVLWSSETTKSKGHQFRASWEIRVFLCLELLTNKWHLSFYNIQVQNLPSSLLCNKSIFARNLENFSNFVHHQIISCKNVWKKRSNGKNNFQLQELLKMQHFFNFNFFCCLVPFQAGTIQIEEVIYYTM